MAALPAASAESSAVAAGGRARLTLTLSLGVLFSTLIIDGFPPGIDILHEFGARLTDFLLIVCALVLLARGLMRGRPLSLSLRDARLWIVVLLAVPASNLPVTVLQAGSGAHSVLVDWVKQYLMFFWGIVSFYIWRGTLSELDARRYCALVGAASVVPLMFFFLEYFDPSDTVRSVLDLFRLKRDLRPSSFASEPAIYAAWLSVIWPLVFYSARHAERALSRVGAAALLALMFISAYLSNARTFSVVMVLQLIYVGFWSIERRQSWRSRIRSFLIISCLGAVVILVLLNSLLSVLDIGGSQGGSDVARFAYTVTGINVFLAHPIVGVGIGQFSNFFGKYAPQFASVSDEVMSHINGVAIYRASTFNLFVRLFVEFGIPIGLVFSAMILRPILRAPKSPAKDPFLIYAALSAVGGIGFWLSQDAYGYEPGILALAILSLSLEGCMRTTDTRRASPPAVRPGGGDL